MERKHFLRLAGLVATGSALAAGRSMETLSGKDFIIPPYLKPGDVVGITSPAGPVTREEIQPAVERLKSWGFVVKEGMTIGKKDHNFGGTDEERLFDLQQMLDDENIKAVMCARGGYGAVRIVDRIEWKKFIARPKWLIGFSDITVLHGHIHSVCRVATIHSKMTNSFPNDWNAADEQQKATINSIRDALTGAEINYPILPNPNNIKGSCSGLLVGGNLKTIESLAGSRSDISTRGKILFVEDTGEYLYSIDRMFWNLKRTGKLEGLTGLIVGGFKIKPDDPGDEFGKDLYQIVLEKVSEYNYAVCFDFPVGHQRANYALRCGMMHSLQVKADSVILSPGKLSS